MDLDGSVVAPRHFLPTPFAYHEEKELEIENLTNEGRGIGRIQHWAVMVPFVIPGERVRVRIFRNHKNYSEADLVEVLTPSPQRIKPVCSLFGRCGGCQYQHIAYEAQLRWKQQHIRDSFERIGKIHTDIQPLIPSEKIYGYRTKLTPHFGRRRGKCPIGFLVEGSKRVLIDVPRCPIASEAINRELPRVRQQILQSSACYGTALLRDCAEGILTDFRAIGTAQVQQQTFRFPAGSFFQNNLCGLDAMLDFLKKWLQQHPELCFLVDTYSGTGVFGIALSAFVQQWKGIEIDESSVALAQTNVQQNHVTNGTVVAGEARAIFQQILFDPKQTCVLLDPPRKGTDVHFLQQLQAFAPKAIVYISCAPDTQARDLAVLLPQAPYRIVQVQPFDLFPQTKHIECIAILERTA